MSELLIGVDLGTTSTKTAIFNSEGRKVAEAVVATPVRWHGRHRCDQDPDMFYSAATSTIRCCLERERIDPAQVVAIGVTGQMAGVMGVDRNFMPSMPYDSWLDLRCSAEVEFLEREIGDEMIKRTGCPSMVNHAPKVRWWKKHEPKVYSDTAKFVMPGGYVAGRLAGLSSEDAFIDHTYLHFTGVADALTGAWAGDLVSDVGIDRDKLPVIVAPSTCIGGLSAEAAGATGLRTGLPVAAGLGDTAAGALGAGIVEEGQLLDVAGTAAVFAGSSTEFQPDTKSRTLLVMRGAVEGQWISLAYLSGGDLLSWFWSSVLGEREDGARVDLNALTDGVGLTPAGARGLLFIPFLDGRMLPSDRSMRGAWLGLGREHSRHHMLRAMLESVPYEYASYLDAFRALHPLLHSSEVRVIGGGGRSAVWNRIKAGVLGLPYLRVERDEPGCWGAALVAGTAVGLFDDIAAAASRAAGVSDRVDPDAVRPPTVCRSITSVSIEHWPSPGNLRGAGCHPV